MAVDRPHDILDYLDEGELDAIDWVLALFYAAGEGPDGEGLPSWIHVQGALYIASQYIPRLGEALEFKQYGGGPWSEEAHDALGVLLDNGWVARSKRGLWLTSKGRLIAEDVWNKLGEGEKEMLRKIASLVARLGHMELLLYISSQYGCPGGPGVPKELEGRRKQLALSMWRRNLVTVELAAKIAGMTLPQFIKYLKNHGYKPYTVG